MTFGVMVDERHLYASAHCTGIYLSSSFNAMQYQMKSNPKLIFSQASVSSHIPSCHFHRPCAQER